MVWVILGTVGAILAFGLLVWYKMKQASEAGTRATQAETIAKYNGLAKEKAEAQIAAKVEQERQEVNEEAAKILAMDDEAERERAAIALLARVRGVH